SIGPALGGFLAAFSYRLLFYGNALSCAIAAIVFYLYFRNRSCEKREKHGTKPIVHAGRSPWKDTQFVLFSLLCCLYTICFFQLLITLPLFYREVHLLDEWDIGLILGFSGL